MIGMTEAMVVALQESADVESEWKNRTGVGCGDLRCFGNTLPSILSSSVHSPFLSTFSTTRKDVYLLYSLLGLVGASGSCVCSGGAK